MKEKADSPAASQQRDCALEPDGGSAKSKTAKDTADVAEEAPVELASGAGRTSSDDSGSVERLKAEVAELKDRLLRALAEQENMRRRIEREREEAIRFAAADLGRDLLPTVDNLRRAIESVPIEPAGRNELVISLLSGVAAIERALLDTLEKHGIRRIEPAPGEPFDPHRHQAMFEVAESSHPPGAITQVLQPGYAHHDRLLRPALVSVAGNGDSERSAERGAANGRDKEKH